MARGSVGSSSADLASTSSQAVHHGSVSVLAAANSGSHAAIRGKLGSSRSACETMWVPGVSRWCSGRPPLQEVNVAPVASAATRWKPSVVSGWGSGRPARASSTRWPRDVGTATSAPPARFTSTASLRSSSASHAPPASSSWIPRTCGDSGHHAPSGRQGRCGFSSLTASTRTAP